MPCPLPQPVPANLENPDDARATVARLKRCLATSQDALVEALHFFTAGHNEHWDVALHLPLPWGALLHLATFSLRDSHFGFILRNSF